MKRKMRILVTGGPVSTKLDAVKIITNRFRGGLMQSLARDLAERSFDVTYLAEVGHALYEVFGTKSVEHDGFADYRKKVLEIAPAMDAVILGAAVANIMPLCPWESKFPSHKYGPDDVIPIDFVLTPRIIDEVKRVAPRTHLFGFKLLANADHEELISAAYDIVLSAHCTAVFANDRSHLDQVYAVTKERAIHPMPRKDIPGWIAEAIQDQYYHTDAHLQPEMASVSPSDDLRLLLQRFELRFRPVEGGLIFGTAAIRLSNGGFITTSRGKKELSTFVVVMRVDHDQRVVHVSGESKATLNAPLLDCIFKNNLEVHAIVHCHDQEPNVATYGYAPPGTVRDSTRIVSETTSFNIERHGCFLLFDKNGRRL